MLEIVSSLLYIQLFECFIQKGQSSSKNFGRQLALWKSIGAEKIHCCHSAYVLKFSKQNALQFSKFNSYCNNKEGTHLSLMTMHRLSLLMLFILTELVTGYLMSEFLEFLNVFLFNELLTFIPVYYTSKQVHIGVALASLAQAEVSCCHEFGFLENVFVKGDTLSKQQ